MRLRDWLFIGGGMHGKRFGWPTETASIGGETYARAQIAVAGQKPFEVMLLEGVDLRSTEGCTMLAAALLGDTPASNRWAAFDTEELWSLDHPDTKLPSGLAWEVRAEIVRREHPPL